MRASSFVPLGNALPFFQHFAVSFEVLAAVASSPTLKGRMTAENSLAASRGDGLKGEKVFAGERVSPLDFVAVRTLPLHVVRMQYATENSLLDARQTPREPVDFTDEPVAGDSNRRQHQRHDHKQRSDVEVVHGLILEKAWHVAPLAFASESLPELLKDQIVVVAMCGSPPTQFAGWLPISSIIEDNSHSPPPLV